MPTFLRPRSVPEALDAMARAPDLRMVAGGTDLYPALGEAASRTPLMDLAGISELQGVAAGPDGVRIGALATWAQLARADLPPVCRALLQAGREVGSPQIQNAGTVVGNICNASPAADGVVALLALDASVEIAGPDGARATPLSAFVLGPRRVALEPGEIVTAVRVPQSDGRSTFLKIGARRYMVISIVMAAVRLEGAADGTIARAAVAVGSCAPTPRRIPALEARLVGLHPREAALAVAVEDFDVLAPIDDVRAEAAYRRAAAPVVVRRCFERLVED